VREPTPKEGECETEGDLGEILADLYNFKAENEELHHIYDQESLALKFKKTQNTKLLAEYQHLARQLADSN
jgi:hypothetical protein